MPGDPALHQPIAATPPQRSLFARALRVSAVSRVAGKSVGPRLCGTLPAPGGGPA